MPNKTGPSRVIGNNHLSFASYAGLGPDHDDYHGGAATVAYWVQELFGIVIHEYVLLTYESFVELVDSVGGVELEVDPAFTDVYHHIADKVYPPLPTGLQRLTGEQALAYAHFRGYPHYPRIPEPGSNSEDGDRIRRNQKVLQALVEQSTSLSTEEMLTIFTELDQHLYTNMEDWDLLELANIFMHQEHKPTAQTVLPGDLILVYEEIIEKEIEYYFLDHEACAKILEELGAK